jgi:hypothetical protein
MKVIDIHPGEDRVGLYFLTGETVNWGKTDTYFGSGGTTDEERVCIGNADQVCPGDGTPLDCAGDYIGGGSHYWSLQCRECWQAFYFDTYRFKLEPQRVD